jgi:hypothetical protein
VGLDDRVEYDVWISLFDATSQNFLTSFKAVAEALGVRAYFTPHMSISDGIPTNCQQEDGENLCVNLCTNNGRSCSADPDGNGGISGADVVRESLRQLCIWNQYELEDGVGSVW